MLYDLNVPWPVSNYTSKPTPNQLTNLFNTISMLYSLGYNQVAINFTVNENVKLPINNLQQINPINTTILDAKFPTTKFPHLSIYTRLTLIISDPARCQNLAKISNSFDLIAIQPTTERALQLAVTNLDIDIVSFSLSSRLPFFLKHKTICSAIDKGIKFEICYANAISGSAGYTAEASNSAGSGNHLVASAAMLRKNFFSNVLQLIRASRERGLIISSGADQPLQVRNYTEILTLLSTLGLPQNKGKLSVLQNPQAALTSGRLRVKSHKQTISVDNAPSTDPNAKQVLIRNTSEDKSKKTSLQGYKKRLSDSPSGSLLKKMRQK